jgi:2-iminobutanoate/2-iminopropanoate deaminase
MTKQIIATNQAPAAIGPYSQAIRTGNLLFGSGQIPLDPADPGAAFPEDITAQTEQVLANLGGLLSSQGLSFESVVKTTVFLMDMADFAAMNAVYGKYFSSNPPARSTVQVAGLPRGAKVEIEFIAVIE